MNENEKKINLMESREWFITKNEYCGIYVIL